jgi:predicted amidophosphoribosyltransferase
MGQVLAYVREYIFPGGCAFCGGPLFDPDETWYGLCRDCRERIVPTDEPRCSSCGRPLISERGTCLPCREEGRVFDGAFAVFPYTGKYRRLLQAYKFGTRRNLGRFFAEKLAEGASRLVHPGGGTDIAGMAGNRAAGKDAAGKAAAAGPAWTPVPPRPGKIKNAGWDQVAYLAGLLEQQRRKNRALPPAAPPNPAESGSSCSGAGAHFPVYPCLKRLPSQSQKKLNRENRKTNLRGRIVCTGKPPREALLFDDVITTGATLDACAAALKAGGTEKVYALSLFYN